MEYGQANHQRGQDLDRERQHGECHFVANREWLTTKLSNLFLSLLMADLFLFCSKFQLHGERREQREATWRPSRRRAKQVCRLIAAYIWSNAETNGII